MATAVESLLRRKVDGLVLTTARSGDDFLAELRRREIPHVLALRADGHSLSVVGDDHLGGYLATRHLLDLGHRRIGIVAGPAYASSSRGRLAGYRAALDEAGIANAGELVRESEFSMEAGEVGGHELLALANPPTAIFAVNDNTAVGVLAAAHQHALGVPYDLSVVGYNDIPLASRLPVPLTSVRVPLRDIAIAAVDVLLRREPAANTEPIDFAPTLIPRHTTSHPRQTVSAPLKAQEPAASATPGHPRAADDHQP